MIRKEKHLKANIGEFITVKLFKPVEGSKEYIGKLIDYNDMDIIIEVENETVNLERKNISLIKKYFDWDN